MFLYFSLWLMFSYLFSYIYLRGFSRLRCFHLWPSLILEVMEMHIQPVMHTAGKSRGTIVAVAPTASPLCISCVFPSWALTGMICREDWVTQWLGRWAGNAPTPNDAVMLDGVAGKLLLCNLTAKALAGGHPHTPSHTFCTPPSPVLHPYILLSLLQLLLLAWISLSIGRYVLVLDQWTWFFCSTFQFRHLTKNTPTSFLNKYLMTSCTDFSTVTVFALTGQLFYIIIIIH